MNQEPSDWLFLARPGLACERKRIYSCRLGSLRPKSTYTSYKAFTVERLCRLHREILMMRNRHNAVIFT